MTESDLRTMLGINLKRFRTVMGFSQAKLAELLDLSPNFVSELETGKRWFSSDTLTNLAGILGVEVYEFFRPEALPPENPEIIENFIKRYTGKAVIAATTAVTETLNDLCRQYCSKQGPASPGIEDE
jgi:transcriptional regulator with XRE-family HTH domain